MQLSSSTTTTTTPWGPLLLALLLPLIFLLYLKKKQQRPARGDDGGDLKTFVKNQHNLVEWSVDAVKRSPTHTATFKAPFLPGVVITANPGNVEHIAKGRFGNYPKGEYMASRIEDFLGRGIFNSDGDQWLWQRKAAVHEFTKRSQRKFVVDTVRSEVAGRLLPLLDRASSDGRDLDMQHVLECFAFDNICHLAFGDDPACLVAEDGTSSSAAHQADAADFMRAFDYVESAILVRFRPPENVLWRVKRALNMAPERQIREALDTVHGYVDRILKTYRDRPEPSRGDFLAHFAASGDRSDENLRDFVTNFLMAGRDTTSSALTWFLWLVSGQPDVEAKIVAEIRRVRGCHGDDGAAAATFTFDELGKMHYVHAAISESMRLYPPVPLGMHYAKEDDVLPDGTFVGKGWAVSNSSYAMARLETLWGKDCEEFRPERWLREEDGTFRPESPFRYPVFHAGPRTCLGKEMAYIQMKAIVACTFERFSFRYLGGEDRPGLDFSFTLRMKGGLPMQVTKRAVAAEASPGL